MSTPSTTVDSGDSAGPPAPSRFGWWTAFVCRWVARSIGVLLVLGLALRFTIRDQFALLAVFFYLTPIPSLPIWILIGSFLQRRGTRFTLWHGPIRTWRAPVILILITIGWTIAAEFVSRSRPHGDDDFTIVLWNVGHLPRGIEVTADYLRQWKPKIIGLVEADDSKQFVVDQWQSALPDYQILGTRFGGILATQGHIEQQVSHQLSAGSWCEQFDLELDGRELTVLLVDISSNFSLSRAEALSRLGKLIGDLSHRPLVVIGDFNTPDDSALLTPIKKFCRHAFRNHGSGYAPTWPVPLPVLTLDQVWVNHLIDVSSCEQGWTACSDHRPVITRASSKN